MSKEKKLTKYLNGQKKIMESQQYQMEFHKILINRDGKVEDTFSSFTKPTSDKIIKKIENLL